jgi:hypothetical protein
MRYNCTLIPMVITVCSCASSQRLFNFGVSRGFYYIMLLKLSANALEETGCDRYLPPVCPYQTGLSNIPYYNADVNIFSKEGDDILFMGFG